MRLVGSPKIGQRSQPLKVRGAFESSRAQSSSASHSFQMQTFRRRSSQAFETFDPGPCNALVVQANALVVDDAPWLFVVHDLSPRALSPKVKGFKRAQSWYQDLTQVSVE
jgi:hypothetical protein